MHPAGRTTQEREGGKAARVRTGKPEAAQTAGNNKNDDDEVVGLRTRSYSSREQREDRPMRSSELRSGVRTRTGRGKSEVGVRV